MTPDPFEIVRAWFAAFNSGDAGALAALYSEDAEADLDGRLLAGRTAIARSLEAHFVRRAPDLDGGARRRIRTIGRIETGMAAEWVARERDPASGLVEQSTGYDHFIVAAGRITSQREVTRVADGSEPQGAATRPSSRQYPERPVVGVGAAIVEANRIVLIKRRFEPLAGQWSLPGGTLEVGETLEAGIAREVIEETGLAVRVGPVIDVFDRILLDPDARIRYHFVLIDYLCRPVGGRLRAGSDVADAIWATRAELPSFGLTAKTVEIAERGLDAAARDEMKNGE